MAPVTKVLRTCGLLVYLVINVIALDQSNVEPRILKLEVLNKNCEANICKYLLKAVGGEFLGHYSWRLTPEGGEQGGKCDVSYPNYEIREIETKQSYTQTEVTVPKENGKIYFCLRSASSKNNFFSGNWSHQGEEIYLDPQNDGVTPDKAKLLQTTEPADTLQGTKTNQNSNWTDLSGDTDVNYLDPKPRLSRRELNDVEVFLDDNTVVDTNSLELDRYSEVALRPDEYYRIKRHMPNHDDLVDKNNVDKLKDQSDIYDRQDIQIPKHITESEKGDQKYLDDNSYLNEDTDNVATNAEDRSKDVLTEENNKIDDPKRIEINSRKSKARKKRDTMTTKSYTDKVTTRVTRQIDVYETTVRADHQLVVIDGIRIEDSTKEPKITEDGVPSVLAGSSVTLRLFGDGLTPRTVIAFTDYAQEEGQNCKFILKGEYMAKEGSVTRKSALFEITAPPSTKDAKLYLCVKTLRSEVEDLTKDEDKYVHQGTEPYKVFATHNPMLPLWVTLILILICLMFSALFSGLNLGLMSLDRTELKIISNTGTEQERKYARAIMPVRDHGNYLLCSILLGNVAVNSTFTILLDELTSGLFAVIFSTLAIVLLGEITPQAICSRHGLMVGAKSIVITKAVMALTAPLAFPVSKLLDYFLGEEIGSVYNRERLKELVKVTTDVNDLDKDEVNIISGALELRKKTVSDVMTKLEDVFMLPISSVLDFETMSEIVKSGDLKDIVNDLDKDEVNIISGALELRKKTVSDVMTKLEDVFMLPISSVLDFETMSEIVKSGYSRIPVYEGSRGNIVTVLFIKDLAFVDPDDNTPLRTLCQYYQNPCNFVFEDVTLDVMFKQFKDGHKGHMAFVHRINNEGEGDPFYETIGLVTLEDVIEEMIQAEIVDETDVFMDNRTKRRRNRPQNKLQDFAAFAERHENQHIHISPQLTLATFQFLATSVDPFRPELVSETVLRRLLRQDVIQHIKLKGKTKKDPSTFVFQQGKPVDYFVLILEGRVEVTVGRENLVFEAGPFTYFGVQALMQNVGVAESPTPSAMGSLQNLNMDSQLRHTFVPDYSVRAVTELFYLTVKRSLYLAAKRATLMEKGALSKGATNEQFDTEVDKHLCHSSSANIPISMISKKLLGKSASSPTAFNPDDCGSCSTTNKVTSTKRRRTLQLIPKPSPTRIPSVVRLAFSLHVVEGGPYPEEPTQKHNIIELLQVTPQNYPSSERIEASSDKYSTNSSRCVQNYAKCFPNISLQYDQHWPNIDRLANACDTTKSLANVTKSLSNDMFVKSMPNTCEVSRFEKELDANVCDECVRNNYWMNKTILNKSVDGKIVDTERTKKKTTFHTDSSLLTFHDLSPDSIGERSDCDRDSIDKQEFDREEFEHKANTDELILTQLSKIIKLLERKHT